MKKDAVIRARVPRHIVDLIQNEAQKQGLLNITDYVRMALLEKLSRDTDKTIIDILKRI